MKSLQTLLDECAARHYHLCPRQVLGVRIALLGGRRLDLPVPQRDKRLLTIVETDGCAADGVAVASGCWVGRRTMRVMDFGKVAATFVDTLTEQAVRIVPRQGIRQRALDYASDAPNRWTAQLHGYQIMSDEELLDATPVVLKESIASILSRDGVRTNCQACGEEIINEREVVREGLILCRVCAGAAYYTLTLHIEPDVVSHSPRQPRLEIGLSGR